jgi:hypothetical protein
MILMEKKPDTYLGLIIILGVLTTMIAVGITRDQYADSTGAAISRSTDKLSFVWTDKVKYAPGEQMLIKWSVPEEYRNYMREVQLVSEDYPDAYIRLSADWGTLANNKLRTNAPNFIISGRWYVRVTTQPYMATSPTWTGKFIKVE